MRTPAPGSTSSSRRRCSGHRTTPSSATSCPRRKDEASEVKRDACRVLYLDGYTVPDPKAGVPASDAIGYGITASSAIRDGLAALGLDVVRPRLDPLPSGPGGPDQRLSWILGNYSGVLRELTEDPPDVIFCFHAFSVFPVEIR